MNYVSVVLSIALASVILRQCINVLNGMNHRISKVCYTRFFAFGFSWIALTIAVVVAMFRIWEGTADISHWLFLISSTGLIAFDRRRRESCFDPNVCRKVTGA